MDYRMEINILDYRLKVMSVQKDSFSQFTHALINMIFLKRYGYDNDEGASTTTDQTGHGFISITETNDDFSLVVEERAVKLLDLENPALTVVDSIWLPLVVSVGPTGPSASGISKIAKSVIIPLADHGISVYCLSTYKTDFILIKECDLTAACEVLALDFRITKEGSLDSEEIIIAPENVKQRSVSKQARPITHTFTCPDNKFYVTSMDRECVSLHALTVIDVLFYSSLRSPPPDGHDSFFCLCIVDQDISLVLDSDVLAMFPPNVLFNTSECWRMMKIGDMPEGLGFVHTGVVAQMSEPIASAQISEYYISSFYYGHTMVPDEHINNVQNLLEIRKAQKPILESVA